MDTKENGAKLTEIIIIIIIIIIIVTAAALE
jgi:flagellar basal body-associated protein FliL